MLAAMDGGRLLAHLETYAVDGTAYLDEIRLSGDSQSRQVSGFLHQEACQVYRQSGQVTRSGWRRIGDLNP